MKQIVLLACAATLAACGNNPNTQRVTAEPITVQPRELFDAKNAVASKTADPDAARFDDFAAFRLSNGDRVYCGYVNAVMKNGSNSGFTPFYLRMRGSKTKSVHFEPKSADFASARCADVRRGSIKISPH